MAVQKEIFEISKSDSKDKEFLYALNLDFYKVTNKKND